MRKIFVAMTLMAALACLALAAAEETAKLKVTNKKCPVSGGGVVEKYRAEYKGQWVYLCCQGCVDEFKANAESFVAKMSKEEQDLIKINDTCPVTKEAVSKTLFLEDDGRKVYFCCESCTAQYKKDHPNAK